MLLRLAYLTVANTFVVLRLLPMGDRDKDTEILALRHQFAVLERQLGEQKVRFTPGDRAFLAAPAPPGRDRTLIWDQHHLLHALHEFERFYNEHRPHQGIANARPLHPLPSPITDPDQIARLSIRRHQRLGGILHEYEHAA